MTHAPVRLVTRLAAALLAIGTCAACTSGPPNTSPAAATSSAPSAVDVSPSEDPPSPEDFVDENGCDLACQWRHEDGGLARPGPIPAGTYTTKWFFPGRMSVTMPAGWSVGEDSTGELALLPPDIRDAAVLLWLDVSPIAGRRVPVRGVENTPRSVASWMSHNRDLDVRDLGTTRLGSALTARMLEFKVSESARNHAGPGCPTSACIWVFSLESQWDTAPKSDGPGTTRTGWPIAHGMSYERIMMATVHDDHTLFVVLDAPSPKERKQLVSEASTILSSLALPSTAL